MSVTADMLQFGMDGIKQTPEELAESELGASGGAGEDVLSRRGGGPALYLNGDLDKGSSTGTVMYGSPPLLTSPGNDSTVNFEVAVVELWSLEA
jgi:hypothetical protein